MARSVNIATDRLPTILDLTGVFETLMNNLQKQTQLRISMIGICLGHGEERGIDAREVFVKEVSMAD